MHIIVGITHGAELVAIHSSVILTKADSILGEMWTLSTMIYTQSLLGGSSMLMGALLQAWVDEGESGIKDAPYLIF